MRNQLRTQRYAVALYRVSTVEQDQSGLGLEAQQAGGRAFAAAQGWTLVAEFSDMASGKDDHGLGFQAALTRCPQLGAVLAAARLDRITRRTHTPSQMLEDGSSARAADMPGADELMMRVYAAMAQEERELISERTRAALSAAEAHGAVLGGDRGCRPSAPPCPSAAAMSRVERANQTAHRLWFEVERLRNEGVDAGRAGAGTYATGGHVAPWRDEVGAHGSGTPTGETRKLNDHLRMRFYPSPDRFLSFMEEVHYYCHGHVFSFAANVGLLAVNRRLHHRT